MRNRARTAGAPSTATRTPAPTPVPEATAPTKTKYDELVEVLVDGLLEIMMTVSSRAPIAPRRFEDESVGEGSREHHHFVGAGRLRATAARRDSR
jgi:hypothetical protein